MTIWTTQFADEVAVGDEVALMLSGHPDATGLIIGEADNGSARVQCAHCGRAVTAVPCRRGRLFEFKIPAVDSVGHSRQPRPRAGPAWPRLGSRSQQLGPKCC